MEEALPLAKNFNVAHAKFLDWVLSVEPQLRAKEATGPEAFEQVQVRQTILGSKWLLKVRFKSKIFFFYKKADHNMKIISVHLRKIITLEV